MSILGVHLSRRSVIGLASALALLIGGMVGLSLSSRPRVPSELPVAEASAVTLDPAMARQIEQWLSDLLSASRADLAITSLRDHVVQINRMDTGGMETTLYLIVDGIASRFGKLDVATRRKAFALVVEALHWFGENPSTTWPGLLSPTKDVVREALGDPESETRIQTLQFVRSCWLWEPLSGPTPEHLKALGSWKADLHANCLELLKASDPSVRGEAAFTVGSAPLADAAAKALPLLQDTHSDVRRRTLLALAERSDVLPSEEILQLVHDRNVGVRTTARIVLGCRGLSYREITLGSMATSRSANIRAQAVRHAAVSDAVDPSVWVVQLSHDSDESVRIEAARALAWLDDERGWERLVQLAESDASASVRDLAARFVARHASNPATAPVAN